MRDFFEEHLRPWLLHRAMSHGPLRPYRERVVGQARGRVLEIGVGSGLNLPYFGSEVDALVGLDPSRPLLDRARAAAARLSVPAEFIEGLAEELPFEDRSFDTALCTFTLCSVTDPARVLDELRRVLRPNGRLLFVEHGRAPERSVAAWQDRLAPCWCRLSGGCHLNRAPSSSWRARDSSWRASARAICTGRRSSATSRRGARGAGERRRLRTPRAALEGGSLPLFRGSSLEGNEGDVPEVVGLAERHAVVAQDRKAGPPLP